MELLAVSILAVCAVFIVGIYAFSVLCGKFYFRADRLEIDFTGLETVEATDNQTQTGRAAAETGKNVIDFEKAKNSLESEKIADQSADDERREMWDDLAAMETERERLENGTSGAAVYDDLDYVRSVHERIAELRDANPPKPAA